MMGDEVKWEIFTPFGSSFWVRVRCYLSQKKKKQRERERETETETEKRTKRKKGENK
jgi:hypothetical protein